MDSGTLKELFVLFDGDGDGVVSVSDLASVLLNCSIMHSVDEIQRLFVKYAKENKGYLTFQEFCYLLENADIEESKSKVEDEAIGIFHLYDKDQDGFLTFEDLRNFAEETSLQISEHVLRAMVGLADENKDSKIDFREFSKFFLLNLKSSPLL